MNSDYTAAISLLISAAVLIISVIGMRTKAGRDLVGDLRADVTRLEAEILSLRFKVAGCEHDREVYMKREIAWVTQIGELQAQKAALQSEIHGLQGIVRGTGE